MIKAEYLRFLQTLNGAPEAVRKIAKLIASHLDDLAPLSTHQGQRVKRFVSLAQANWESINPEIQSIPEKNEELLAAFSQLNRMTVGPFRGFAREEIFDLASRIVLVYGPNGTGKSSFCEALEYGLLGNVVEAETKRFRDQNEYLKNAFVNHFSPPIISAEDSQGNEILITPNEAVYRFCFVEKNRIDSFSRIAAQAPAKQEELISTLFGLESFTEFVRNFTAEIDDRYIDLVGAKKTLLTKKQQSLSGAQQQIQNANIDLEAVSEDELKLANQYREGSTFNQMVLEVNGSDEALGTIERLEREMQNPLPSKSNLNSIALETLRNNISTTIQNLNSKQQELAAASQQVSFKQLYEAVSQVQISSPSACPACKTPLNEVAVNPYKHSVEELQKLQELAKIQQETMKIEQNVRQYLFNLSQIINTFLKFYSQSNPIKSYELDSSVQPSIAWWNSLNCKLADARTPWQHIVAQVQCLEESDKKIDQATHQKAEKQAELIKLRDYSHEITILKTRRQTLNKTIIAAKQMIDHFQKENEQLISDVEAERAVITKNQEIKSAYNIFVRNLNNYSSQLPAMLVSDLGEIVVDLYNAFNRNDSDNELLANVTLPLAQNQRLKISFTNQPNKFYDALHLLSEGHIRCLGLAILLAKNLKENAPVLIFDDPVNAIDDDHRESIRRTLFEDQYFSEKQILLTCHGEEFFKDINNLLPAKAASQVKSFSFLPRLGEQHIRVDFNCSQRNYILSAREYLNKNEIRVALAKSRQALESLTKGKIWRYVSRYGDGNLSLKLRSPSASIELRNLTEQLKGKIGKQDFSAPNKETIFGLIDNLLGEGGESREWRYLNKGTHDEADRAEFDRYTVEKIVSVLEALDIALA